jgi:hypothetical protein
MTFAFEFDQLNNSLRSVLQKSLSPQAFQWLEGEGETIKKKNDVAKFNIAFVAMPRKSGKGPIVISDEESTQLSAIRCDRLARVWLLMMLPAEPKEKYISTIENLFLSAEMSELVALYSSLPVLAYPESWRKRCAEGIRSNIGQVLEAVICNNPYPSEYLDEIAWNQLVLKAIFTDKPILEIIGILDRANKTLAESLSDYAHERWAAHREVNPLLWMCVGPFVDNRIFSDIQRLFASGTELEKQAAALVCSETKFSGAKALLDQYPQQGVISWKTIADKA